MQPQRRATQAVIWLIVSAVIGVACGTGEAETPRNGTGSDTPALEIAYVRKHAIVIVDLADGETRGVGYRVGDELFVSWSPDGSQLAFVGTDNEFGVRDAADVYIVNVDGSGLRNLTQAPAYYRNPSWSPDGQTLVLERDEAGRLFLIDSGGSNLRRLVADADVAVGEHDPAWSPDGRQIAFSRIDTTGNQEIAVIDSAGAHLRNLTQIEDDDAGPVWSPDGKQLAFVSYRDGGNAEIFVMNADGSGDRNLSKNNANDIDPAWSPDGHQIAFISQRDGPAQLFVVNTDGTNLRRLSGDTGRDQLPAWSPDGQWIAFLSDHSDSEASECYGVWKLHVVNVQSGDERVLGEDAVGCSRPAWRPT